MERPGAVDPVEDAGEVSTRQLGRSALWTGLAMLSIVAVVVAARSDTGLKRINEALDRSFPASTMMALKLDPRGPSVADLESENRKLARTVQDLTADRDRIVNRLAALERGLDVPVTGSIPSAAGADTARGEATSPVVASVTLIPAQQIGPVENGAAITESHPAAGSIVTQTQFGIDLGVGADLDVLRHRWTSLKAQHAALVEGLHPVVASRENGRRGAAELRLVVGPLANAAAAARLCALLAASVGSCQPGTFEGQQLALR